jgi:hypothetical protein
VGKIAKRDKDIAKNTVCVKCSKILKPVAIVVGGKRKMAKECDCGIK